MNLAGVLLPVTTPLDAETGEPAAIPFRANLRAWTEAGVHGFVLAGSTGEAPLLEESEVAALAEWARDIVPQERLLIIGTGAESTRATIRMSVRAGEGGADAVLVRPPSYYRKLMDPETLRRHYLDVADASPIPVILYHVPALVPVEITAGLLSELAAHPNIVGVKDSTGDLKNLAAFLDAAPPDFRVMVGSGSKLYAGLEMGAAGGIVAVGCVAPELAVEVYVRFRAGAMAEAGAAQGRLSKLDALIVRELGVPGIKRALDLLGLAGGAPRPPLRPLDRGAAARVREALRAAGLLQEPT